VFEKWWKITEEVDMNRILVSFFTIFIIIGCSEKSKIPSLKYGENKFISCFFQTKSVYNDVVFDVKFDKKTNSSELVFIKPPQNFDTKVITYTDNRLSLELTSNKDENFLINFYFDTSNFDIKSIKYNDSGSCEEKIK
jgi:hypothetical protein